MRLGAACPSDFTQVVVNTAVQEKNIAHPMDTKLAHKACERLVNLAKKHGVPLRQSYVRVRKKALIRGWTRYLSTSHVHFGFISDGFSFLPIAPLLPANAKPLLFRQNAHEKHSFIETRPR